MNITEVWLDALHGLTINNSLQSEHTVGRWVVRTDVDGSKITVRSKDSGEEFDLEKMEWTNAKYTLNEMVLLWLSS